MAIEQSDRYPDGAAPLTRSQRLAVLAAPGCLIMSALHVWDGLNGPAELIGNVLILPLAANQLHAAIGALSYFSWAVTSASILFYSRRSA